MRGLMAKYQDMPMDLADAAIVRVAERQRIHRVFTTTTEISKSIVPPTFGI
jgi:predicted nucleic acid-binding protein